MAQVAFLDNLQAWCIGNPNLLGLSMLGVFSSVKCPGSLILAAHEVAKNLSAQKQAVISGFQSPVENEMLAVLLQGESPIVICPARGLSKMRIPLAYRDRLNDGRLLLVSRIPGNIKRYTSETALERNRFVAELAEKVLVIHAESGGKLINVCRETLNWGKPLYTIESEHNRALIEMGAQLLPADMSFKQISF